VTSHRVPHLRLFEFLRATPVGLAIIVALLAAMFGGAMAAGPDAVGPSRSGGREPADRTVRLVAGLRFLPDLGKVAVRFGSAAAVRRNLQQTLSKSAAIMPNCAS
jgi:hypothetical protein